MTSYAHPDPLVGIEALDLVERALAGCEEGCRPVLDEVEAMEPERRREVVHELLSMAAGGAVAAGGGTGEGAKEWLEGVRADTDAVKGEDPPGGDAPTCGCLALEARFRELARSYEHWADVVREVHDEWESLHAGIPQEGGP